MATPINLSTAAYEAAMNGSFFQASYLPYTVLIGDWFWVILWLFLLIITYLRTEDMAYVFTFGLLGMLALSSRGLFPFYFRPITYLILAISLMITLYAFFVRTR